MHPIFLGAKQEAAINPPRKAFFEKNASFHPTNYPMDGGKGIREPYCDGYLGQEKDICKLGAAAVMN